MPHDRIGFYCELPSKTIRQIKLQAKFRGVPHWKVIVHAIDTEAPFFENEVYLKDLDRAHTPEETRRAAQYAKSPNFTALYASRQSQPKTKKDHGRKHTSRRR